MSKVAPKILDGLLFDRGDGLLCGTCVAENALASFFDLDERGNMDEADRNPNLLEFLGGNGGGVSSLKLGDLGLPGTLTVLFMYFFRMKRSMAESASSASTGTGGLVCPELYILFEATFPTFRMFCRFVSSWWSWMGV